MNSLMELLLFMCLLLSALLLCLTLEAVSLWCLLLLTTVLLQIYKTLTKQNDANRYIHMVVRKAIHIYIQVSTMCNHGTKNDVVIGILLPYMV